MEVTRYLFQSPYSSQVQIGRPDTSSTSGSAKENSSTSPAANITNLETKVEQDSTIYTNADKILDIYA